MHGREIQHRAQRPCRDRDRSRLHTRLHREHHHRPRRERVHRVAAIDPASEQPLTHTEPAHKRLDMTMPQPHRAASPTRWLTAATLALCLNAPWLAHAQLSQTPLLTPSASLVKPNVVLTLDDSG